MDPQVVLACILSSSVAGILVSSVKDLIMWRLNRKAKIEDDRIANDHESLKDDLLAQKEDINQIRSFMENVSSKIDINSHSMRVILKDRIQFLALHHIRQESISFEDRKNLHEMWHIYHFDLGGNGDLNDIMELVDELPLKEAS